MYFSRIVLREDAPRSSEFWQAFCDPYTLHQSVWRLFGDYAERKRDFLYRLEQCGKKPLIYTVSARKPDMSLGIWNIESKEYKPRIKSGMQLAFMLRANPVRTKRDEKGKHHRHDVIMEAKTLLAQQQVDKSDSMPLATLVQKEAGKWLSSRAEKYGFAVNCDYVRADGYRQHRFFPTKGNRQIAFSTVDYNGILTVISPEHFVETLYGGIGPAKGFGCGMMMIKKV